VILIVQTQEHAEKACLGPDGCGATAAPQRKGQER
jgi:hypothetical protein